MIYLKVYTGIMAFLVALVFGAIMDSRFRVRTETMSRDLKTISRVLPSADPGINNSARYIRHLGLSVPGSAFPDFFGQADYLPSGMMWPPPATFVGMTGKPPINETFKRTKEGPR